MKTQFSNITNDFMSEIDRALNNEKLKEFFLNNPIALKDFPPVIVNGNMRMRSVAGRAFCRYNKIDLNFRLLSSNKHEIFETFLHELAHLFVYHIYKGQSGIKSHGKEFKFILKAIGGNGETYHNMDVSELKHTRQKFGITCHNNCHVFQITKYKFNRLYRYRCPSCKGSLTPIRIEKC